MDHRIPLKLHTVLTFEGMSCHVEEVVGQGSNAIVYKGWYQDSLNRELRHHVLVKELFPFHPQQRIYRGEDGGIVVAPEAEELWQTHRESFEVGNRVHLRLLYDQPELMVMGANLNSYEYHGTLYSVLGYTGGRSLQAELNRNGVSLGRVAQRMICLLDALEAFHKSGYLHLDISPDNIMLVGQEDQEHVFLIDYNSARELGSREGSYLSCKSGFSAPEVRTGTLDALGFASDLYSVAAVFFRCIMGRSLTLTEVLQPKAPDGQQSPTLRDVPPTVCSMVGAILKKGLHTLARRRYQSIGQMRQAFQELLDRIDCVGVTHWSLWEKGKQSVEELIRENPSLRYLKEENRLYPIRLEYSCSMPLEAYVERITTPEGKSGLILAQGGMGKTTLLLHTAMLRGKRYAPAEPAVFYLSLNGWDHADSRYIRTQMLMRLRFKREENSFDSAMHALHKLLEAPIRTRQGDVPKVLLLLDGLNEVRGDPAPLVQEICSLKEMAGVRLLAASRSEIPELKLETVRLMPLELEDIGQALGKNGLLIPQQEQVLLLLRTPLILSLYIQASECGKQLEVENEDQLLKAYLASLLEKELRQLPEDAPQRWQIDGALHYVLPAIAAEGKKQGRPLTQLQMLQVVTRCWNTLGSQSFRRAYPHWIGHSADLRGQATTPEEWYGIVVNSLLWKQLGMLTRDDSGGYRIFHQRMAEHLLRYRIPVVRRGRWAVGLAALLLCAAFAGGYQHYTQETEAQMQMQSALELGAVGYVEYGDLYQQLRSLVDNARSGNAAQFQLYYERVLAALQEEAQWTDSEETEARKLAHTEEYDQKTVACGAEKLPYEYDLLSELLHYPDERAAFYGDILPVLKASVESEALREKAPAFHEALSDLLEADANLVAEMYHRSVGVHLSGGDTVWLRNITALVAMVPELDAHRTAAERDHQRLSTLQNLFWNASSAFEQVSQNIQKQIQQME